MLLQLSSMVHIRPAIRGRFLCRSVGSALFVAGCSSRICGSRSDKKLVAGKSVAASKNANRMRVGGRKIQTIFGIYTRSKSRLTGPGPNTEDATARITPIMSSATPLSSKNVGINTGNRAPEV
jgi:hypothetical protein